MREIRNSCRDRSSAWCRCAVLACLVIASASMARASSPPELTLILPSNSAFTSDVNSLFPGLTSMEGYSTVEPYLALLKNTTTLDVEAYCVEFKFESTDAVSTSSGCVRYVHERLSVKGKVENKPMLPGDTILLAPIFINDTPVSYELHLTAIKSAILNLASMYSGGPQPKFDGAKIDAVIYTNGEYVGADNSHTLERYLALRTAERDISTSALALIHSGAKAPALRQALEAEMERSGATDLSPTANPAILYQQEYARRRALGAQKLLESLSKYGVSGVSRDAKSLLSRTVNEIKPQGGQT